MQSKKESFTSCTVPGLERCIGYIVNEMYHHGWGENGYDIEGEMPIITVNTESFGSYVRKKDKEDKINKYKEMIVKRCKEIKKTSISPLP